MIPSFSQILDALKLGPRYLAAIALICGVFLFAPEPLAKLLHIADFAKDHGQWFGVGFIVSVALLVVDRSVKIIDAKRDRASHAEQHVRALKRFHSLTEEEKKILRFYLAKKTKTNMLRVTDGVVNGLVAAKIIWLSSETGSSIGAYPHNISDFAWEYLQEHPEVLDGTSNEYRTDLRERF